MSEKVVTNEELEARRKAIEAANIKWSAPEPLITPQEEACPYPLDDLPAAIESAVEGYQQYGKQPMALVATSALAALSLCGQGLVDVARDSNLVGPTSLSALVIACSGERCDKRMTGTPREWQEAKVKELAPAVKKARSVIDAHAAERVRDEDQGRRREEAQ